MHINSTNIKYKSFNTILLLTKSKFKKISQYLRNSKALLL